VIHPQTSLSILQATSGDYTTVEMNAVERTLYNSTRVPSLEALPAKRDS